MKRGFTLTEVLVVLVLLLIAAAILFPVFARKHETPDRVASCLSNLQQISLGLEQYTQDFDESYPLNSFGKPSATGAFGWADVIYPYTKSLQILQCPLERNHQQNPIDPTKNNYTDYWINSRFLGLQRKKVVVSASSILLGDGNDGTDSTNSRYNLLVLPPSWLNDSNSPVYRHKGRYAAYCFAGGMIKMLPPQDAMHPKADGHFSFALR